MHRNKGPCLRDRPESWLVLPKARTPRASAFSLTHGSAWRCHAVCAGRRHDQPTLGASARGRPLETWQVISHVLLLRDGRRSRPPVALRAPALGASHHKLIAYGAARTCWCWSFWGIDRDHDRDRDHDQDRDQDHDLDHDHNHDRDRGFGRGLSEASTKLPYLARAMSMPLSRWAAASTSLARPSAMAPNASARSMAATTSQRLLRAIVK